MKKTVITAHDDAVEKGKPANQKYLIKYQPVGLLPIDLVEIGFLVLEDLKDFPDACEGFHNS